MCQKLAYYASIMHNAFNAYYVPNYAGIIGTSLPVFWLPWSHCNCHACKHVRDLVIYMKGSHACKITENT